MRFFGWTILTAALISAPCSCRRAAPGPAAARAPRTALYFGDPEVRDRLLRGIQPTADTVWTQRLFAVRLDRPEPAPQTPLYFDLDFDIPEEMKLGTQVESVTLAARVNGAAACRETYRSAGRQRMTCPVPAAAQEQASLVIEFETDRTFRVWETGEERALVLGGIQVQPYEATEEYRRLQSRRAQQAEQETIQEWEKIPPARRQRMRQIMAGLPAWSKTNYLGVHAGKNPADLWMVQQLLYEVLPDFVVATCAQEGGAALFYAKTLENLGNGAKVITTGGVEPSAEASGKGLWKAEVEFIRGAAAERSVAAAVAARVSGGRTLVILGAGEAGRDVAAELKLYAPLVSPGSYLVVEDTDRDTAAAVRAFLARGGARDFEPDRRRESLLVGFNTGGWLKRR